MKPALLVVLLALLPLAANAQALDARACEDAITRHEARAATPPGLLLAIARTESGRPLPGGRVAPWPWTINVAGTGYFYESAPAAIAAVQSFQAAGVRSIDVGCMQINLVHHPAAFATLQQAFDPAANVAYGATFLTSLQAELGGWSGAVAAYHSRTPDLAAGYARQVLQSWPLAAAYGVTIPAARRPALDPKGVYTPEFARQLAADQAFAAARDRRLGVRVAAHRSSIRVASARP